MNRMVKRKKTSRIPKDLYSELCDRIINHAGVITGFCNLEVNEQTIKTIERRAFSIIIYIRSLETRLR